MPYFRSYLFIEYEFVDNLRFPGSPESLLTRGGVTNHFLVNITRATLY